jgi:hypothetical protein
MNNSKIKTFLLVALGATTLALSCTSARELSQRSTRSTPLYQAVEDDAMPIGSLQSEPEADYTGMLNDNNEEELSTGDFGGLMLPSDLDQGTTEDIATADASLSDLPFKEEEKKSISTASHANKRMSSPVEEVSNNEIRTEGEPKKKTNSGTSEAKEHYTVIITTDSDGLDSEQLLSQLEDAIASLKRGEHRDVTVEEEEIPNQTREYREEIAEVTQMQDEIINPKEEVNLMEEDANEFDQSLEDLLEEEINKAPSPALTARKTISQSGGFTKLYLGDGQSVVVDEGLLIEWEHGVAAEQLGLESDVALPKWLLQGIEWLTHAPKAEPVRSQTIMPVYRYMKNNGVLSDVDLNKMTPVQVVQKLRVLVDELKAAQ